MRICFFANLAAHADRRELLRRVEFYNADLTILRELGHTVIEATTFREIDRSADLYYCWWWGPAVVPALLARLRGKPAIVTGAFDYATCRTEIPGVCYLDRPLWQRVVIGATLRLANANLFISRFEYEEVTHHLRVPHPWLVPLSVDTDRYCPQPHEPFASDFFFSLAWTSSENVIRKGVETALKAFAVVSRANPRLRFVLAGKPGDGQVAIEQLVDRLGIRDRVEFRGAISLEEKIAYFRQCLGYVQPSLYEGFGAAIAEAASTGCPVVSCPNGAVPEVAGPDALLVTADEEVLAKAMLDLVDRPRVYEEELARHAWINENYRVAKRRELIAQIIAAVS